MLAMEPHRGPVFLLSREGSNPHLVASASSAFEGPSRKETKTLGKNSPVSVSHNFDEEMGSEQALKPIAAREPSMADLRPTVPQRASRSGLDAFRTHIQTIKDPQESFFSPSITKHELAQVLPQFGKVPLKRLGALGTYPAAFVNDGFENYVIKYTVGCHTDIIRETFIQQIAAENGLALPVIYLSPPSLLRNRDLREIFGWECNFSDGGEVRYQVVERGGSTLRRRLEMSAGSFNMAISVFNAMDIMRMVKGLHVVGIVKGTVDVDSIGFKDGDSSDLMFLNFADAEFVDDDQKGAFRRRDVKKAVQMVLTLSKNSSLSSPIGELFRSVPHVNAQHSSESRQCLEKAQVDADTKDPIPYDAIISYLKTAWDWLFTADGQVREC